MQCLTCLQPLTGKEQRCPACGAAVGEAASFSSALATGSTLQGQRYRLGKVLGQGGFGITYTAQDTVLDRMVAIKELFPEGATRHGRQLQPPTTLGLQGFSETKTSFISEARTVSQFNHPNIVRVWDIFEENNTAYMVMELLQGQTLSRMITQAGHLDVDTVLTLADQLLSALEFVHRAGLLHRDIKPDNIFVTPQGQAILIDFGSARNFVSGHTVSHTRLVTPGYAPPEQYATKAVLGPYTDIYALAATLHHALSGQMPSPATDRMIGSAELYSAVAIPAHVLEVLTAALELQTNRRPQSVAEFRQLLLLGDPNPTPSKAKTRSSRKNREPSLPPTSPPAPFDSSEWVPPERKRKNKSQNKSSNRSSNKPKPPTVAGQNFFTRPFSPKDLLYSGISFVVTVAMMFPSSGDDPSPMAIFAMLFWIGALLCLGLKFVVRTLMNIAKWLS